MESQALQESLELANGLHLVYHSARTSGYLSILQLQLTPEDPSKIPPTLVKVHMKITIEGVVHEKVFEADPDIRYTFAWDRLNEYRQVRDGVQRFAQICIENFARNSFQRLKNLIEIRRKFFMVLY